MQTSDQVKAIIADALYLDVAEVQDHSNLMQDLGAESIDFLDIMFRLEKAFGIKLPKGDIERRAKGGLTDAEFAVDGRLTARAIQRLRVMMPEVSAEDIGPGLLVRDIPSLFTVATFSRMVDQQLSGSDTAFLPNAEPSGEAEGSRM